MGATYWLDAGVLISAKNGLFAMDVVPSFWTFIEGKLTDGSVRIPKKCFDEIVEGNDQLAVWCKAKKSVGYFCCKSNGKDVQARYKAIAQYVYDNNPPQSAAEFLKGADGWVIAHAQASGGFVVTEELRNKYKHKIKIPVLAKTLRVPWKSTQQMCRELGFRA